MHWQETRECSWYLPEGTNECTSQVSPEGRNARGRWWMLLLLSFHLQCSRKTRVPALVVWSLLEVLIRLSMVCILVCPCWCPGALGRPRLRINQPLGFEYLKYGTLGTVNRRVHPGLGRETALPSQRTFISLVSSMFLPERNESFHNKKLKSLLLCSPAHDSCSFLSFFFIGGEVGRSRQHSDPPPS